MSGMKATRGCTARLPSTANCNCVLQGKDKYQSYYEDTKYNQLYLRISPEREGDPITVAGVDYEVDGLFLKVCRTKSGHLCG